MSAKTVIYTAIIGDSDTWHEPKHMLEGVDYVCFTDNAALTSRVFTMRPLPFAEKTRALTARRLKLQPHHLFPDHELSLWIDGAERITGDITPWLKLADEPGVDMVCLRHPVRQCLFDEGRYCQQRQLPQADNVPAQLRAYRHAGMPHLFGLAATSVLLRRHHRKDIKLLMNAWWNEVKSYSPRDQVSFPFVLWQNQQEVRWLDYKRWHNGFFRRYPHKLALALDADDGVQAWAKQVRHLIKEGLRRVSHVS